MGALYVGNASDEVATEEVSAGSRREEQDRQAVEMQRLRDKDWSYAKIADELGITKAWSHRVLTVANGNEPNERLRVALTLPETRAGKLRAMAVALDAVDPDGNASLEALLAMFAAGRLAITNPDTGVTCGGWLAGANAAD